VLRDSHAREPEGKIQRLHLTNRQDVINICQQYGVNPSESQSLTLHQDDVISVEAWIAAEKENKDTCRVLFYKEQGILYDGLAEDDFVLVIQTPYQRDIFKKFATDRICIDSTHGTNAHDFQLTSIFVVDQMEQGFPGAFCLSTRVNHNTMKAFFSAIKNVCGGQQCQTFMTDDAAVYKNAWSEVMGPPKKSLLCAWHVDRAWQGHLKIISNDEKRKEIYKLLKAVLTELDVSLFKKMYNSLIKMLYDDDETVRFGEYLTSYYGNRKEQWAYCYRKNAKINVNMYLEAFHKLFKHQYQDGKKNKRVDKCLKGLLHYVEDIEEKKMAEAYRGKSTKKSAKVLPRHKLGLKLKDRVEEKRELLWCDVNGVVTKRYQKVWYVPSSTTQFIYRVREGEKHACSESCGIRCFECDRCYKSYVCTCPDFSIQHNMCKHIHAAICSFTKPDAESSRREIVPICQDVPAAVPSPAPTVAKPVEFSMINKIKELSSTLSSMYDDVVDHPPPEVLRGVLGHLEAAIKMSQIKKLPSQPFSDKVNNEPANKKVTMQRRSFHSVKKKKEKKEHLQAAKSEKEMIKRKDILLQGQTLNISTGHLDEHNYL